MRLPIGRAMKPTAKTMRVSRKALVVSPAVVMKKDAAKNGANVE